jgi:hypothetical protein
VYHAIILTHFFLGSGNRNLIHASQFLEVFKPLPLVAKKGDGFVLKKKTIGIHENGKLV